MGRTVIIEECVENYISSLYGSHKWQIGLIVGQLSSQRDYILHLARTPDQSGNSDGSGETAALDDIENRWIIEHAHQVSRMLTGGLDVIGVFAFGPMDMLTKSQAKIRQLLFSIQKTVQQKSASYFDDLIHSRILLQICSETKKITCRTIDVSDQQATPNPAEVKYQSFSPKWIKLETSLSLTNGCFDVPRKLKTSSLHKQIMGSIHKKLQSLSSALCTVNGELYADDQTLVSGGKSGRSSQASSKSTQTFKIDLFTDEPCSTIESVEVETAASISISGSMSCRAYMHQKATAGEAVQALKYDAIRSFLARCEVLCEDVMDNQEEKPNSERSSTWTSPQRVFVPLGSGPVTVCDYVFKDETLKESKERIAELLGIEPKEEDFECSEEFPDVQTVGSLVEEMETEDNEEITESEEIQQGLGRRVIGAVVGVVVAVVAAGVTFLWGENTG
ncbi:protein odr-4 homolog isoform X2 [Stylophora pistillata]|uniref:protein odr-4 homolog isoform X2 n=1 Tax=Stylophora pistillata TaxID=50429 RepID=UPI000C04AC56|nr:protein odr-4 homolog isoform X2 [Stylophora pistillata]